MRLYRTAQGRWVGTQDDARKANLDEGSKPGSWKAVDVPTDKAGLLAFLNYGKVADAAPTPPPAPAPEPKGSGRYRTYFKGLFIPNGVIHADNADAAHEAAVHQLQVRPDLAA